MSSVEERIIELITKPQVASFATLTEDGKPWARNVVAMGDKSMTFRLTTSKNMRKVKHVLENPKVHLNCGANTLTEIGPYVQVEGIASVDETPETKEACWNPGLLNYFSGPSDPNYVVIVIKATRIEYKTPENIMDTQIWVRAE